MGKEGRAGKSFFLSLSSSLSPLRLSCPLFTRPHFLGRRFSYSSVGPPLLQAPIPRIRRLRLCCDPRKVRRKGNRAGYFFLRGFPAEMDEQDSNLNPARIKVFMRSVEKAKKAFPTIEASPPSVGKNARNARRYMDRFRAAVPPTMTDRKKLGLQPVDNRHRRRPSFPRE